jgi:hypothetical protein
MLLTRTVTSNDCPLFIDIESWNMLYQEPLVTKNANRGPLGVITYYDIVPLGWQTRNQILTEHVYSLMACRPPRTTTLCP